MLVRAVLSLLVLAIVVGGCSDPVAPAPRIEDTEFAAELDIELSAMTKTASGLYMQDLLVGTGVEVVAGDSAAIYYTGRLPDGSEFDSRQPPDDLPLAVFVSVGGLIRGFAEGMIGMREGGRRTLIIPPHLGYGVNPPSGIPSNAILVFVIDLVDVK